MIINPPVLPVGSRNAIIIAVQIVPGDVDTLTGLGPIKNKTGFVLSAPTIEKTA